MTQEMNRNDSRYIRILELLSVIGEEHGKVIESTNNYLWKGEDIQAILNKINSIKSPLMELEQLLEIVKLQDDNKKVNDII